MSLAAGFSSSLRCCFVRCAIFPATVAATMWRGALRSLPTDWSSIAIPAFKNDTTRYRIEQRFTEAVIHEFITRTKYRVVQDEARMQMACCTEKLLSIETSPVIFNSTTGEVETMLVTIHAKVLLVDNKTSIPCIRTTTWFFATSTRFRATCRASSTSRVRRWGGWRATSLRSLLRMWWRISDGRAFDGRSLPEKLIARLASGKAIPAVVLLGNGFVSARSLPQTDCGSLRPGRRARMGGGAHSRRRRGLGRGARTRADDADAGAEAGDYRRRRAS